MKKTRLVNKWKLPADGIPIITMPNIPKPLFGFAPRTILGQNTWNHMRKRCYFEHDYKCEICGAEPEKGGLDAHELYEYDYTKGRATFIRTVCVCKTCHRGIHSGRMLTLFKHNNPYMTKRVVLSTVEHVFNLVHQYNTEHPKRQIRVYATYLEYLKEPRIAEEVQKLIDKYDINFYGEDPKKVAGWSDWHLVIGDKTHQSPYTSEKDWREKMAEQEKKDVAKQSVRIYTDDVRDNFKELLDNF